MDLDNIVMDFKDVEIRVTDQDEPAFSHGSTESIPSSFGEHPFLQESEMSRQDATPKSASQKQTDENSEESARKEKEENWMKMYNITEKQLSELKECFYLFEHDGSIAAADVGLALRAGGQTPTEAELQSMLHEADVDEAGTMIEDEFVRISCVQGLKTHQDMEEELEQALRTFDKDGAGVINASDFKNYMTTLGEPIPDDEIAEILKLANVGADGKFGYAELLQRLTEK